MREDPIFEPWSGEESAPAPGRWGPPAVDVEGHLPVRRTETVDLLRGVAVPRLEAIGKRLEMARHETSLEDLLDESDRLLRFDLKPWPGPLSGSDLQRSAMLEFGVDAESPGLVRVWYWLDRLGEAPDKVASLPTSRLTISRIERVILDFVEKVLQRG